MCGRARPLCALSLQNCFGSFRGLCPSLHLGSINLCLQENVKADSQRPVVLLKVGHLLSLIIRVAGFSFPSHTAANHTEANSERLTRVCLAATWSWHQQLRWHNMVPLPPDPGAQVQERPGKALGNPQSPPQ